MFAILFSCLSMTRVECYKTLFIFIKHLVTIFCFKGNYVLLSLSRGVKSVIVSVHDTLMILIDVQLIIVMKTKRGLMLSNLLDL